MKAARYIYLFQTTGMKFNSRGHGPRIAGFVRQG